VDPDEEISITFECGVPLPSISKLGMDTGLSGADFLIRIPGNLGGALSMNSGVGFRGIEVITQGLETVRSDWGLDYHSHNDIDFDYRYSSLQETHEVVYSGTLKFRKEDPASVKQSTLGFIDLRKSEPRLDEEHSLGSIILRRGNDELKRTVFSNAEDFLEPDTLGIQSQSAYVKVPARKGYSSWAVATPGNYKTTIKHRGAKRRASPASLYDLAEVMWQVGQIAADKRRGVTLFYEAKFLGFDNKGQPLQKTMQDILSGHTSPVEMRKNLELGGKYLNYSRR
jgi:hypothetical protein